MPLPLLFIGIAAATGGLGVGKTIKAGIDANNAKKINKNANEIVEASTEWLNTQRMACGNSLRQLGEQKLFILNSSITEFFDTFTKIKNVDFRESEGLEELKKFHVDEKEFVELKSMVSFAGSLAGGAVAGTAGGALAAFGAYGTAQALACASTGTAIASLSGAAATNATLAFFGGGSLAAGGLGMVAIGVGGADAVDVMTGMEWELKMPKLIGVKLTGSLNGWASPKDVILKLAGILTVKGGTNAIIEYFGPGTASISATGKATICNMGAEVGATTSLFPFDNTMAQYLRATGRDEVASWAEAIGEYLEADMDVRAEPDKFYDRVIVINLSELEPHINGPFTPDAATPISEFAAKVKANGYPRKMEVGLIGSCTNSSYQDLSRAASIARQAYEDKIPVAAPLIINPGSEQIRYTAERDGIIGDFERIGATIMANACGPCIGQWKRHTDDNTRKNSIVTSFNRNFAKRADGNPNTHAFVASPELTLALTIAGDLCFNPLTDTLKTEDGKVVKLKEPKGTDFPPKGFEVKDNGYLAPTGKNVVVNIDPESNRLQALKPFAPWNGEDFTDMPLLIKAEGKCTTDHISMAGPWLRFRGHLENISDNMLMGAVNAFNGKTNSVLNQLNNEYEAVSAVAKQYKANGISSIVVAEENYGEGSSREHAAMEPRFLNVKVILAKSFARIHETNLKKQGMLALTFANKEDYSKIRENDHISIIGLKDFQPGKPLTAVLLHADGTQESFPVNHTYNDLQIKWFKAGSALNTAH